VLQQEIAYLEEQLRDVDERDCRKHPMRLAFADGNKDDPNEGRERILVSLKEKLKDYGR
jgi:hypothetical protein